MLTLRIPTMQRNLTTEECYTQNLEGIAFIAPSWPLIWHISMGEMGERPAAPRLITSMLQMSVCAIFFLEVGFKLTVYARDGYHNSPKQIMMRHLIDRGRTDGMLTFYNNNLCQFYPQIIGVKLYFSEYGHYLFLRKLTRLNGPTT